MSGVLGCLRPLALLLLLVPGLAYATPASKGQERRPLGSLSAAGEVNVNGALVPAESTIFTGDMLNTGATGTATFSMSGKGSFKIAPQSQLAFAAEPQYLAELKAGTVVMGTFGSATDFNLRAGNFTVVPVVQGEPSASKITREPDGSFSISCLEGSIGVLPIEGTAGRFLQSGQSVVISLEGQLGPAQQTAAPPVAPSQAPPTKPPTPGSTVQKKSYTMWIVLGVAGAGAAGIAAAAGGHGSGSAPPISPSRP
jgi:ferric-dicitrate binding protein FerR (iron transport regulator)